MLKICSVLLAITLLGCQLTPRNTEQSPTAHLAGRALQALGGCEALAQAAPFGTATSLDSATELPRLVGLLVPPVVTRFEPCWLHAWPERVNIQTPALLLLPIAAVFPSLDSATE